MTCVEDLTVRIHYDENFEKQYFLPGDVMKGVAILYLRSSMRVRHITMFVLGAGVVSWENTARKKVYTAREDYLQGSKILLDGGYEDSIMLRPGPHEFFFGYQLPTNLPSTFNGVYGSVTYVCKVVVQGEHERDTTITSEPFLVYRRPSLSPDSYLEKQLKKSKNFRGLTNAGNVVMEVTLNQTAGIPGQDILVDAEVTNWSQRQISLIQASIIMQSVFHVKKKKLMFRQIINKRIDPDDTPFQKGRRWRKVKLTIPPHIPESGLEFCDIIDVTYFFQFRIVVDGQVELEVETPIEVGGFPDETGSLFDQDFSVTRYSRDRLYRNPNRMSLPPPDWRFYDRQSSLMDALNNRHFSLR